MKVLLLQTRFLVPYSNVGADAGEVEIWETFMAFDVDHEREANEQLAWESEGADPADFRLVEEEMRTTVTFRDTP